MRTEIEGGGTGLAGDNEFHKALADGANNRVLQEFVNMCGDLLEVEREEHLRSSVEERHLALSQHVAILKAVVNGDSESAQRLMQKHILNLSTLIKANRIKRPEDGPSDA